MTNNVLVLHFDDPPGSLTNAAANPAQLSGGSPVTTNGKFLSGLAGDGTHFLTGTSPPVTLLSAGTTMMVWVYRRSVTPNGYLPLYNGNGALRGYGIIVESTNEFMILTGSHNVQATGRFLPMDQWSHLALSVETGDFVTAYINGEQLSTYGLTISTVIAGDQTFLEFAAQSTDIIDEAAMWARILTPAEIQTIYSFQSQPCS